MTGPEAPEAIAGQRVIGEPRRLRHELAWTIELPDGRRAVIAQLVPELAAEPSLRRRWVADMERVAEWSAPRLAPTLAIGPAPDPRAMDAVPPWRVRLDPAGTTLDQVLARSPLPLDEAIELGARLADAVQTFHGAGAVLRELDPRSIVVGDDQAIWFTDVGHARLSILSSRTASSLLLESSPYVAPEAQLQTVVDARADVYSLGGVLWHALVGRVPFEASLVASRAKLPDLVALRPELPRALATLVTRCLAHDPEQRPPTARDVAAGLRGTGTDTALVVTRVSCQACGAAMRVGLRLCLACGKQAVQFHRAAPDDPEAVTIELQRAKDDAPFVAGLHEFFSTVATAVPRLNFVVGDARMYSKSELAQRHRLPAILIADLAPATSEALVGKLRAGGYKVRTVTRRQARRRQKIRRGMLASSAVVGVASIVALGAGGAAGAALAGFGLIVALCVGAVGTIRHFRAKAAAKRLPLGVLRSAPAALPAGDALVARIATALTAAKSPDVRARVEELALLVQRVCDAKAGLAAGSALGASEAERITAPVAPLVELASTTSAALDALDAQLATLDEGALVRALARCDARHEAPELRQDLLAGLDTLRRLEEERARLFGRLLELTSLMRAAVTLGLQAAAAARDGTDVEVAHALAALDD